MKRTTTMAVLAVLFAVLAAGCDAPKEQKDWGAREGGLNLPPKEGSDREREQAEAAAAAARAASDKKAAEARRLENRKGGLNLAPKRSEKPRAEKPQD